MLQQHSLSNIIGHILEQIPRVWFRKKLVIAFIAHSQKLHSQGIDFFVQFSFVKVCKQKICTCVFKLFFLFKHNRLFESWNISRGILSHFKTHIISWRRILHGAYFTRKMFLCNDKQRMILLEEHGILKKKMIENRKGSS